MDTGLLLDDIHMEKWGSWIRELGALENGADRHTDEGRVSSDEIPSSLA